MSAQATVVILEGVGAARRKLTHLLDALVWVQSDTGETERRGILRGRGGAQVRERWDAWITEETPFLIADRPWERATIVAGTAVDLPYDPIGEVVIAHPAHTLDLSSRRDRYPLSPPRSLETRALSCLEQTDYPVMPYFCT